MDLLSTEGIAVCLKQGKHCRSSLPVSMLLLLLDVDYSM